MPNRTKSRIDSIIKADLLDASVTGIPTFSLSLLEWNSDTIFELPTNLRLGHLAERVVSELIKKSSNYEVIYENVQLNVNKRTIGEIDFIIRHVDTLTITHLELAYKFYLYDLAISSDPIKNWIGPNRNDSLREKLEKLKEKQFPLLYSDSAELKLNKVKIDQISQALCFLVSLYIPYGYKEKLNPVYEQAIKGYYVDMETFLKCDHSGKSYYLPLKIEWGIDPSTNDTWMDIKDVKKSINVSIKERRALLCWQKYREIYSSFFITWW